MGRFWFGLTLLALMLAAGLWIGLGMDHAHQDIAAILEQAAEQAMAGDLEQGIALSRQAQTQWDSSWQRTATVADHAPMDEIDSLFAQLQIYGQAGNTVDFAAYCTRLSKLVTAVGEAHALSWKNLL